MKRPSIILSLYLVIFTKVSLDFPIRASRRLLARINIIQQVLPMLDIPIQSGEHKLHFILYKLYEFILS